MNLSLYSFEARSKRVRAFLTFTGSGLFNAQKSLLASLLTHAYENTDRPDVTTVAVCVDRIEKAIEDFRGEANRLADQALVEIGRAKKTP